MSEALKILIADDDEDDHFFFKESISHNKTCNHKVTSVYHGLELMDYLLDRGTYQGCHNVLPDIIVLDLNMPFLDGFGALKEMKTNNKLKTIPVFILSVSRNEKDRELCALLGSRAFYVKPTSGDQLKVIIEDILDKSVTAY